MTVTDDSYWRATIDICRRSRTDYNKAYLIQTAADSVYSVSTFEGVYNIGLIRRSLFLGV